MKNIRHLVLSSSLVLMMAFGLAGCSTNKSTSKSSSSKEQAAKVVKQKKHDSSSKQSTKSSSKKNSQSSDNESSSTASSSQSNTSSAVSDQSSDSTSSQANQKSQRQLGLSDVAVWTDSNGVTHHVDSDGMDRQTSPNSQSTTYADWSGSLPSQAQIVHQN